jgi:hypothetical protein
MLFFATIVGNVSIIFSAITATIARHTLKKRMLVVRGRRQTLCVLFYV